MILQGGWDHNLEALLAHKMTPLLTWAVHNKLYQLYIEVSGFFERS